MTLRNKLRGIGEKLLKTGFFSVFSANVLSKVLTFIGGTIIVRVMSKSDYGEYTYIINCYNMLILLNDLGCSAATMQFCNEHHADKAQFDSFYVYGLKRGLLFSGVSALLLFLSPWFYPFQQENARWLTQVLCLMPFITTVNNFLMTNLRTRLENARYGRLNIATTLFHYTAILPMAYFLGIKGAVFSNYVIALAVMAYGIWESRKHLDFDWHSILPQKERKPFLKLAVASQLNNCLSHALVLLDVFLLGVFSADTVTIASYKVASTIPSALAFVPTAVMVYVGPYFIRNNQDVSWLRKNYAKLIGACAAFNAVIVLCGIALGPWGIPFLFGSEYTDAVACYTVLMIGYFFQAVLQIPSNNVIYMIRKVRVNIIITVVTGLTACVLDVVLILGNGSIGAACASALVRIVGGLISSGYMTLYLRRQKQC